VASDRRESPRKLAALAKESALQQVMLQLDNEDAAANAAAANAAAAAAAAKPLDRPGISSQKTFVKRIQAAKTVMDLLECVLDLEEILANVDTAHQFNHQKIRRNSSTVHTNYIMLPLFSTPVPDDLMKSPQLSIVAARVYNLEYAIRVLFTELFDDDQKKKYYKKRKGNHGGRGYHLERKNVGGKRSKVDINGSPSGRGTCRGNNKPATLCGLLTVMGDPIEICTTCGGTSTRKNGSNRGKMQRWCVDCQKSYRVRDALTPAQVKQGAASRDVIMKD